MSKLPKVRFIQPASPKMGSYALMFIRDMGSGIMPFYNIRPYPFTVSLSHSDQTLEQQLITFFQPLSRYKEGSLAGILCDVIDGLSQELVTDGEVTLELEEDNKSTKNTTIDIKRHTSSFQEKIIHLHKHCIDIVPLKDWKNNKKKIYVIPSDRIWYIQLPRELGTPKQHRNMMKRLDALSNDLIPRFTFEDDGFGQSVQYNLKLHSQARTLAIEKATARWGSIPSLYPIENMSDYYNGVNYLRIFYSKALIREHLIREINTLLARLNIMNSIKVRELKSAADKLGVIQKFEAGEMRFNQALKEVED